MLATSHMDKFERLQKEDGVRMTFQVIIQGESAENSARKVMGFLYPGDNSYNDKMTKVTDVLKKPKTKEGETTMVLTNNEVKVLMTADGDNIRKVEAETNTSIRQSLH